MNKEEKQFFECYRELYLKSNPSADFDKLVENASLNERGEKEISFNDYVIDDNHLHEIIEKHAKKIKPKWKQVRFKNTILLGCSPKSV